MTLVEAIAAGNTESYAEILASVPWDELRAYRMADGTPCAMGRVGATVITLSVARCGCEANDRTHDRPSITLVGAGTPERAHDALVDSIMSWDTDHALYSAATGQPAPALQHSTVQFMTV